MKLVSTTSHNHTVNVRDGRDTGKCRCICRGKCRTLRTLPSRHGSKLASFFHSCRTIGLSLGNLNWQKWVPGDFSKNNLS
jgi:hypothetical protein